jgi:hypothetical protein
MGQEGADDDVDRHATLALQKVNTYGLIYTWQGADASLKPLLLMGHYGMLAQDSCRCSY